jgi:pimeloyl-ACP methyl ester carboxylesterase
MTSRRNESTIICLHASASSGAQWAALRSQLEPDFHVLTPDFHGHGIGPAWHGMDTNIVAADAARVAQLARGVRGGVHLVGHSYGGAIALRVALHYPEIVASVVVYEPVVFRLLFDLHGRRHPTSEIIDVESDMRRCLRSDDMPGAAARFVDYWSGRGAWHALSALQQAGITKRIGVITTQFASLANDTPRLADYYALRAPVLMLTGKDTNAPVRRIGELLRLALPNASFDAIPSVGHMGPVTHPCMVARSIADFVREQAFDTIPVASKLVA